MSLHDLFRGLFGLRGHGGGGGGGGGGRGPQDFEGSFFGGPWRDDEDDDHHFGGFGLLADDDENDDSFPPGWGGAREGDGKRFGFGLNVGPDELFRFHDNLGFGNILHEMEQLFQNIDSTIAQPPRRFGPDGQPGPKEGQSLRDYMLKSPDDEPRGGPHTPSRGGLPGRGGGHGGDPRRPPVDSSPPSNRGSFDGLPAHPSRPFDLFDFFRRGFFQPPMHHPAVKEDQDLDSRVKSDGLDSLLRQLPPKSTPGPRSSLTPGHAPGVHSFFSSVSVSTVTMPDGTVEERKTVVGSDGKKRTVFRRYDPRSGREMEQREEEVESGPLRR